MVKKEKKEKKAAASGDEPAASEASPATAPDSEPTGRTAAKKGPPPADYRCAACNEKGHWVFDCSQRVRKFQKPKKTKTKTKSKSGAAGGGIQKRPKINF
ncbi:hypothetical protein T484DRAFT_1945848 [Baffinella frigidus]|nr:hypothetical protein T484DRAFT_1945848 [Cryptophyta sp. CCMP2293]